MKCLFGGHAMLVPHMNSQKYKPVENSSVEKGGFLMCKLPEELGGVGGF